MALSQDHARRLLTAASADAVRPGVLGQTLALSRRVIDYISVCWRYHRLRAL
jgi:hypothetical protein